MTCPNKVTAPIRLALAAAPPRSTMTARCANCTTAGGGRRVPAGPHEQVLTDARARQSDPAWVADYRATRPKSNARSGT